jgi:putative NIF3 family GTP cyclohydrolase 1 type 2
VTQFSRRDFIAMTAAGVSVACRAEAFASPAEPFASNAEAFASRAEASATQREGGATAQDVVDRIKKNLGVDWKPETFDTFKAGDPATVVTGIATTAMATLGVLNQAVKAGANFVITYEPTFYSRADKLAADPVSTAKDAFIKRHGLVVWRFGDHWRLRKPDPLAQGLAEALGWSKYASADDFARLTIPAMPLDALASRVKQALDGRGGVRVIGDPTADVRSIGLLPGNTPIQAALKLLPSVDAIIGGEVREWESAEYVRDKVTAGEKKSLILVGRVLSEEPGMKLCAQWLGTIVPELKASWIRVGDPYWRPL